MGLPVGENSVTTVSLPTDLCHRIESRISGTAFSSVGDYVAYVLEQVLAEQDRLSDASQDDDASVRDRLASLGYV